MVWWVVAVAFGAEVTEMPPKLRGDVDVLDSHRVATVGLVEDGVDVGRRLETRNDLRVSGEFSPVSGLAIRLAVPLSPSMSVSWADARQMAFDPITGSGTYGTAGPATGTTGFQAGGLTGVELGVALAPFSEQFRRPDRVTWRLDAGLRLPTSSNLWTASDGRRGAGNGSLAVLLGAAFSTRRGLVDPYLAMNATLEQKKRVDVIDEAGRSWGEQTVKPASVADITGGVEIRMGENKERATGSAFDLHVAFAYRSYGDQTSGVWLPTVLDASRGIVITQEDGLYGRAGFGFVFDVHKYFGFKLGFDGMYALPYTVEHVYRVTTSPLSVAGTGWFALEGRIR